MLNFFFQLYAKKIMTLLVLSSAFLGAPAVLAETPELDFIGGYYENGKYKCFSEPCFTIHKGTDAAASRVRAFVPAEWQAKRGECQKSYTQVLANASLTEIKYAVHEDCAFVVAGQWRDAYTGDSVDDIRDIALDHRISPKEAHFWGAAFWSAALRQEFMNDPINLVPVSIAQIRVRKGRSSNEWMPSLKSYWCDYVVLREIVIRKYQLRPPKEVRDFDHQIKTLYCKF